jgi:aminobenzoyl-glutamate transport protein
VTTEVRSLLSADGIRFMVTSPVANFMGFGAVGVIIVAMVGVGLAERSGLVATLVKQIVRVAPRSIFTFIVVMLGVVSSIAADAGYLVLVPLGAAAFHSLGRHPLAGLAAAFLGRGGRVPRQPVRDADRRAAGRDDQRRGRGWSTRRARSASSATSIS